MELGIILKNLIIVGVIGGVAFASQSAYFRPAAQNLYSSGIKSDNSYIAKTNQWLKNNIYGKLGWNDSTAEKWSGEVAKNQASLQQGIVEQKNNLVESSTNATKKIIAEKFLQILGITPQELGACPAN